MTDRKELLISWKKMMNEEHQGQAHNKAGLEKRIIEEIKKGNMLLSYVNICQDNDQPIEPATVKEMLRLYQLVPDGYYFDITELDEIFQMKVDKSYKNEEFKKVCMDLIIQCPVSIKNKQKLYNVQPILFRLGSEADVWHAYRNKHFFPRDILEELFIDMKNKEIPCRRLAWLVSWMSVSQLSTSKA